MKKLLYFPIALAAIPLLVAVSSNNQEEPGSRGGPGSPTRAAERILSVELTAGEGGFDLSYAAAKELRTQALSLVFAWDDLEPASEMYDARYLPAANRAFGRGEMLVTAGINPLDTLTPRTPRELRGKKLDDPAVVERYKSAVDFYLDQAKNPKITAFVVGNEIDGVLGADEARWREYEERQVEFVREMFRAWDACADRISMITFFAMSDLARAELDR